MTSSNFRASHSRDESHMMFAGADPSLPDGHLGHEAHTPLAIGDARLLNGQAPCDTHGNAVEQLHPRPAKGATVPNAPPPVGESSSGDQDRPASLSDGVATPSSPTPTILSSPPMVPTSVSATQSPPGSAISCSNTNAATLTLADPLLALAADVLDDLEAVRIANENRLRQLTKVGVDKDGEERGFGLTLDHPDVVRLIAMVRAMRCNTDFLLKELGLPRMSQRAGCCLEHDAERNLTKRVKDHPLGPWIRNAHGVGDKQGARLLASIGDPYIRPELTYADGRVEPSRPRTVYELNAFCGMHVVNIDLPGGHRRNDPQRTAAAGRGHPDQILAGTQSTHVRVAPFRAHGKRLNWNPAARMRVRLIAESILKSGGPYREEYDKGRVKYADAVHAVDCRQCGPKGKPAPAGSPLSEGHKHARALRLIAKRVLRDLWREGRRLHQKAVA